MPEPIIADNSPKAVTLEAGEVGKFTKTDLATWDDQMAKLTGVQYAGFSAP